MAEGEIRNPFEMSNDEIMARGARDNFFACMRGSTVFLKRGMGTAVIAGKANMDDGRALLVLDVDGDLRVMDRDEFDLVKTVLPPDEREAA